MNQGLDHILHMSRKLVISNRFAEVAETLVKEGVAKAGCEDISTANCPIRDYLRPVWESSILRVIRFVAGLSLPSSCKTPGLLISGHSLATWSASSSDNLPCSTNCMQATPVIIFVQEAIQKILSRVMGSFEPKPRLPAAWANSSWPSLPTAIPTRPGTPLFVSSQATWKADLILSVASLDSTITRSGEGVVNMVRCRQGTSTKAKNKSVRQNLHNKTSRSPLEFEVSGQLECPHYLPASLFFPD